MRNRWKEFIFENFEWDELSQKLYLRYSFDGEVMFEEVWSFEFELGNADLRSVNMKEVLDKAFEGLWLAAGVSYFKAGIPSEIVFRGNQTSNKVISCEGISESQAKFFEKVWMNGLGEFFYENEINPEGVVKFPDIEPGFSSAKADFEPGFGLDLAGALLPIGGGKDSMTSAILLREAGVDFETWTVGDSKVQSDCCHALGVPRVQVRRQISPELLRLNKEGALNGHVPISSILAFAGIVSALLRGKKYVVLSNEASANEPNTVWKGMDINHQWSKSLEFEREFQKYVSENICGEVKYFSLLRPLSELRIAEIFAKRGWDDFGHIFSSCNRNFHLTGSVIASRWCGECPKCVFVSLILAPWLSGEEIEKEFGSLPFGDVRNEKLMEELLGLDGIKPLECVGTISEARQAVMLGAQKHVCLKKWAERLPHTTFDYGKLQGHLLPEEFALEANSPQPLSYIKRGANSSHQK